MEVDDACGGVSNGASRRAVAFAGVTVAALDCLGAEDRRLYDEVSNAPTKVSVVLDFFFVVVTATALVGMSFVLFLLLVAWDWLAILGSS
jgi:hypothetical protein